MEPGAPPPVRVATAGPQGFGVFALGAFRKGDCVLEFGGELLPEELIQDFTHTIQVDDGLFLGPSGGSDDFVNHSCNPNTYLVSKPPRVWLIASRDILPGEEITFDYATGTGDRDEFDVCYCGAPQCRGRVSRFWDLPPKLQRFYRKAGAVPNFVLQTARMKRA